MKHRLLLLAIVTGSLILSGCDAGAGQADTGNTAVWDDKEAADKDAEEAKDENSEKVKADRADEDDMETAGSMLAALGANDSKDNDRNTEDGIDREAMKAAYLDAIETINEKHILPDGTDLSDDMQPLDEDFSGNDFAVYDVDGDGVEELVISFKTTYSAAMQESGYGYDADTDKLYEEYTVYPYTEYYSFGFLKEMDSHNQGVSGTFWPYTLHKYNPETKEYEAIAYIEAWDGNSFPEDMSGDKFPSEYDEDGDGMLYYMTECSEPYRQINDVPYDYMKFREWLNDVMCDRSGEYAQIAHKITPTWQHFTDKAIKEYGSSDGIRTGFDDDYFTEFRVKDMTFYLPNDFIDKVYVKNDGDTSYTFYHKGSSDAWKKENPDDDFMGGYLFSVEALDDEYEVDYSESFDYLGSSPSSDGKTEYYNYVIFTPTDWPAYGDADSVREYTDIYHQYEDINEEIENYVKFPYLPNYKDFEKDYEQDHGHSFWDDYDKSQEKDKNINAAGGKQPDAGKKKDKNSEDGQGKNLKTGRNSLLSGKKGGLDQDIATAYDKIASKKEYSYDNEMGTFALHDLNADGIPELIIDPDGQFVSDNLYYTYDNGKAVELDVSKLYIPVYGNFLTSSKSGTFCFYRGGPATYDEDDRDIMPYMYLEYSISKGKVKEGDNYTGINYSDDDSWKCTKNGKDISYSEFDKFVKSMDGTVEFVDNTAANRRAKGLE